VLADAEADLAAAPIGGGQVGDAGKLSSLLGFRGEVEDTSKPLGKIHALRTRVVKGAVNVGDVVRFEVDSSELTPQAQTILNDQSRWLNQYPQYTVTVEGHADERGTREYNIALGARRATSVKSYLASHGVTASRLRTISYGKERPIAVCDDISCWSQNRRAQTVLNNRAMAGN